MIIFLARRNKIFRFLLMKENSLSWQISQTLWWWRCTWKIPHNWLVTRFFTDFPRKSFFATLIFLVSFNYLKTIFPKFPPSFPTFSKFWDDFDKFSWTILHFLRWKFVSDLNYDLGLSKWKFHSILTKKSSRSPSRCSRQRQADLERWKSSIDRKMVSWKAEKKIQNFSSFSSENSTFSFSSHQKRFHNYERKAFDIRLTTTRSIISHFCNDHKCLWLSKWKQNSFLLTNASSRRLYFFRTVVFLPPLWKFNMVENSFAATKTKTLRINCSNLLIRRLVTRVETFMNGRKVKLGKYL